MRTSTIVGLALAAAMVVAAAVAAPSVLAAEPAFYACAKAPKVQGRHTGGFDDKTCSEPDANGEGRYEFEEGIGKGKPFKGKGKGADLEVKGLGGISCTSSADSGRFTGPGTAAGVEVVLKGCEFLHLRCENTATPGEVRTSPLVGEVGYVEGGRESHEVGVALSAQAGLYDIEFRCGEIEVRASGTVIARVTSPLNVFTKETALLFQQSAGEQRIKKLEGGPEVSLFAEVKLGGEWRDRGEAGVADEVLNKGETLELKA